MSPAPGTVLDPAEDSPVTPVGFSVDGFSTEFAVDNDHLPSIALVRIKSNSNLGRYRGSLGGVAGGGRRSPEQVFGRVGAGRPPPEQGPRLRY